MTTMTYTSAPLRLLFDRLDFAPEPHVAKLAAALECWERLRVGLVAPRLPLPSDDLGPEVSVFVRAAHGRDYLLQRRGAELEELIGGLAQGAALSAAPKRRQAVRLRRLLELAIQKGEPVLASFSIGGKEDEATIDLIAAPVADTDGPRGALVAYQARRKADAEAHPPRLMAKEARPVLFSLGRSGALATTIASRLGVEVAAHQERDFEDGEHKIRPLTGVRNQDVYVIADLVSSSGQSVNDKLCKLLFFIGALKQSAARTVTLVAPYLCYARKERQTKPRDPVVTRYLAQILEAVGVDCVITVTAHDLAAFQNAFRCRAEHLDTYALFARALAGRLSGRRVSVVSPDPGGEKRAELFRQMLERTLAAPVGKALVDKARSMGKVTGELFAGDLEGRTAVILDDMISTGGTMARAAAAAKAHGAAEVIAVATHGLFTDGGKGILSVEEIDEIWVTDSVPLPRSLADASARKRLHIVPLGPLLAGAIQRCHAGGSINELLEHESIT
jgi:ribose-phosphate pyrophosphokinase